MNSKNIINAASRYIVPKEAFYFALFSPLRSNLVHKKGEHARRCNLYQKTSRTLFVCFLLFFWPPFSMENALCYACFFLSLLTVKKALLLHFRSSSYIKVTASMCKYGSTQVRSQPHRGVHFRCISYRHLLNINPSVCMSDIMSFVVERMMTRG